MKHKAVRKFLLTLFLLLTLSIFSHNLIAQQNNFIYIQTENKQPFYVRLDNKIFSSAAAGYLIIPKLADGSYQLSIGFPKNEWPEQKVTCTVNKKDAGYSLKNFGNKGWGLFNLQTLEIAMAVAKIEPIQVLRDTTDDAFSNMLSSVVNDRTIKEKEPEKEEVKPEIKEEIKPDVQTVQKIERLITNTDKNGTEMVFVDRTAEITDTIRLFIPADKMPGPEIKKEEIKEDKKFIDIELPDPNTKTPNQIYPEEKKTDSPLVTEKTKPVLINSNCKNIASPNDYIKLRKKMVAENNDDDMIAVARKIFKTKCFTTEQVKTLSALFLKEDGKYKFFDASYPYVSDFQHFASLESQLSDAYYISRFRVMLKIN